MGLDVKMADKIAASIAFVIILVYLGGYAYLLNAVPLSIIIAGVLIMVVVEYYESMKKGRNNSSRGE